MLNNRRFIVRILFFLILISSLIFITACGDKTVTSPVTEPVTESIALDEILLEDAKKTNDWQVFMDDIYGLYGFKDSEGNIVIEASFIEADNFEGGRAIVKVKSEEYFGILDGGVYGLIDPEGEFVLEPDGLITRVDQWHYLYAIGNDYYPSYGKDSFSMIKREFLDANGQMLGDERFYYVEAINEDLFLANTGSKSLFINSEGKPLKDYPEFEFAVSSVVNAESITIQPLDDTSDRIKYEMSMDGKSLESKNESGLLTEGVSYTLEIISPYIGSSVIFPVLSMSELTLQDKLNQAIQNFAEEAVSENDLTGETVENVDEIEQINQTVVIDFSLSLQNNLMNVDAFGYFYGFGAAHPNSFMSSKYLDFSTGEVLTLESLFGEDVDWRLAIVKEVDYQFMTDEDAYLYINKTQSEAERLEMFYNANFEVSFEEEYMTVYFPVYEIAPYAAGMPSYDISYAVLDDFYDWDSDFYKALLYY